MLNYRIKINDFLWSKNGQRWLTDFLLKIAKYPQFKLSLFLCFRKNLINIFALLYNFLIFLLGDFFSSYGAGGLSECLRSCVKWAIASQSAARVLSQSAPGAAPVSLFLWPISAPPPQLLVHFEQKQRKDETIENGQLYEVSLKLKTDQTHPEAAKPPLFW